MFDYDGDGRQTKRHDTVNSVPSHTYYLHSSVLGQIVSEIESYAGSRRTGFVYADGELIATQSGGAIFWQHSDPSKASHRTTLATGFSQGRDEVDPQGVKLDRPNNHHYNTGGSGGVKGSGDRGEHVASLMNISTCDFSGMAVPCAMVGRLDEHIGELLSFHAAFWDHGRWDGWNEASRRSHIYNTDPELLIEEGLDEAVHLANFAHRPMLMMPIAILSPVEVARRQRRRQMLKFHLAAVKAFDTQSRPGPCELMARNAQNLANQVLEGGGTFSALPDFDKQFAAIYLGRHANGEGRPINSLKATIPYTRKGGTASRLASGDLLGQSDFKQVFKEESQRGDAEDQTHHFAAYFSLGINGRGKTKRIAILADESGGVPDDQLAEEAFYIGQTLRADPSKLRHIGSTIRSYVCAP